jgi:hypothetical protein
MAHTTQLMAQPNRDLRNWLAAALFVIVFSVFVAVLVSGGPISHAPAQYTITFHPSR